MELTYYQHGDYLLPNLTIGETHAVTGKYEMLRKTFLKENRTGWYLGILLSGKLDKHLAEVEKAAEERMEILMESLLEKYPAPDKGKDQLVWTAHMNMLIAMAKESILEELVYC